jgi:hypothetical protein
MTSPQKLRVDATPENPRSSSTDQIPIQDKQGDELQRYDSNPEAPTTTQVHPQNPNFPHPGTPWDDPTSP